MKKMIIAIVLTVMASGSLAGLARAGDDPTSGLSAQEQKRMFRKGAKLWPVYCNTCHNARPGSEKAPYEWDQIMMHMRSIGNFPADDYKSLLVYLKSQ